MVIVPRADGDLERGSRVAQLLGDRFLALAECQQEFLAELRVRLTALDSAIAEDSRARLKGALRDAVDVIDWCDAVQADLKNDSRRAASGQEPLDLLGLCSDVVAAVSGRGEIQVTGQANNLWWGNAGHLADAVRQGLALVAERTGGAGARLVEVGVADGAPWIRIAGHGEPGEDLEAEAIRRFREAVGRVAARVVPDALGPGGAGFVLKLPVDGAASPAGA